MNNYESHNRGYAALPMIEEAEELSDKDAACLQEVGDVLGKYGVLDRFGLCVLHKHFELEPDEILVEFIDHEDRSTVTRPVKMEALPEARVSESIWRLDGVEAVPVLYRAIRDGEETVPLSGDDVVCFQELKAVLEKYGSERRLGPCLIDKRFFAGLKPDESVYEVTDHSERSSHLRVGDLGKVEALSRELGDRGKRTLVTFDPTFLEEVAPELAVYPAEGSAS